LLEGRRFFLALAQVMGKNFCDKSCVPGFSINKIKSELNRDKKKKQTF